MLKNIIHKPIDSLIFAEYNPRQLSDDQYKHLKDSISRFGLVDPIIINKNKDRKGIIIGGHQRVKVARTMGIDEVPCVEIDLTYDKEKELNVRLNKNTGSWDYDVLANTFDIDELLDWGFDEKELQLDVFDEEKEGLIDDDAIPEDVESVCKLGDLWQLGEHRLLCGDSTKKENLELLLDGKKADMVFTDPPYGVGFEYNSHKDHTDYDEYKDFCFKWLRNIDEYSDYIVITGGHKNKKLYYEYNNNINELVWLKKNGHSTGFISYYLGTEPIIVYGRPPNKKRYKLDYIEETIKIHKDLEGKHTCPKPVNLIIELINPVTEKENLILDIFLGSGTTLIACEKTNRKCYGMELDEKYCDVIIERWEQFTGKKAELLNGKTKEI